jgi:hypothetical protein
MRSLRRRRYRNVRLAPRAGRNVREVHFVMSLILLDDFLMHGVVLHFGVPGSEAKLFPAAEVCPKDRQEALAADRW